MSEDTTSGEQAAAHGDAQRSADGVPGRQVERGGPRSLDGVSSFMGLRWEDAQTVRMRVRPELINGGGLLSGVATYAMVDYCMGSTLWVQTAENERIATISISINYVQTATSRREIRRSPVARTISPHLLSTRQRPAMTAPPLANSFLPPAKWRSLCWQGQGAETK